MSTVNAIRRFCLLALPVLLMNATAAFVLARAGGGSHFSGGGGGWGGGGGSWGGGGGGSWGGGGHGGGGLWIFDRNGNIDWVGVTIIIIVVCIVLFRWYQQYKSLDDTYLGNDASTIPARIPPPQHEQSETESVTLLRRSDPAFDAKQFYARVQTAFLTIQQAWSAQNLDPVRPFISDAILERFTLQFDEQRFLGYRNLMKDVSLYSIHLAKVESDHLYDTVTVSIRAAAIDMEVTPTGALRGGSRSPEPFMEYWSFLRKRGATSIAKGLIEGHCPNCGAAVEINQNTNCPHCKAALNNAQYDWVLTEITQESEWQSAHAGRVSGLEQLLRRDPNFTAADLEDRASVMFWRLNRADRLASVDPIRKIALPAFVERYPVKFTPDSAGARRVYLDCGVGSVTTLAVVAGDPAAGTSDHALLEVRWSGTLYNLRPSTPPHKADITNVVYSWFVLKRSSSALTDPEKNISSAHCPNCGAPLSNSASNACEYCNTILTDGTHGWLLDHITPRNDAEVKSWLQRHAATV